jgi:MYXO-CTERM domain-containing protein
MPRTIRQRLTFGLLGLTLALSPFAGPASAQTTSTGTSTSTSSDSTGAYTGTRTTPTRTDRDDHGFNPGWLGLIGLAGLAGLMPRKTHTVTTHRTGDTAGR